MKTSTSHCLLNKLYCLSNFLLMSQSSECVHCTCVKQSCGLFFGALQVEVFHLLKWQARMQWPPAVARSRGGLHFTTIPFLHPDSVVNPTSSSYVLYKPLSWLWLTPWVLAEQWLPFLIKSVQTQHSSLKQVAECCSQTLIQTWVRLMSLHV